MSEQNYAAIARLAPRLTFPEETGDLLEWAQEITRVVGADLSELHIAVHIHSYALHDNIEGEVASIEEKTTPSGSDLFIIEDSAADFAKKSITVDNILSAASTNVDGGFATSTYLPSQKFDAGGA